MNKPKKLFKTSKRALVSVVASLVFAAVGCLGQFGVAHAAGTATLSLSPATQTKTVGQDVTFNIVVDIANGSDPVNAIQANLSYPTASFSSGTASCGSTMPNAAQNVVSGGVVKLACYIDPGGSNASGTFTVGTVTLHTSGAATPTSPNITFLTGTNQSAVVSANSNTDELASTNGGTYTLDAAPSGGGNTGGGTSGGGSSSGSGSSGSSTTGSSSSNSNTSDLGTGTPKAPDTGFGFIGAHPAETLAFATIAAGLIFVLARRVRRLAVVRAER